MLSIHPPIFHFSLYMSILILIHFFFSAQIIHKAVDYFTGKALEYDMLEESDWSDSDEDDDEDDDEEGSGSEDGSEDEDEVC